MKDENLSQREVAGFLLGLGLGLVVGLLFQPAPISYQPRGIRDIAKKNDVSSGEKRVVA